MTQPPVDPTALAVVVARLDDFRDVVTASLDELRAEVRGYAANSVPRSEWEAHRAEVDRRIAAIEADIGDRTHVDHADRMWKSLHDHEDRLRSIERKVWTAAGSASLMGAILGVLLDTIISYAQL